MLAFTSDTFVLPLPPKHRFPMAKYRRLRERVEADRAWRRRLSVREHPTCQGCVCWRG